ncbi:MAG TPA: GTP 3',8-cyclase MoaA [Treponema sp.]|nr:GTP 3',8-cyclase MoaA [Treponema sp.]
MLVDAYGRVLDYLRVSVTDRCNFRCVYCMPESGVEWKPHAEMLSFEEALRVCRIMAGLGVGKIKLTGGEPLLRRGLASFVENLKTAGGIEKVTLTTNGVLLGAYLDDAETARRAALPDGVNISLNALDGGRFAKVTRNALSGPEEIICLVDRLLAMGIPVKINCVPVRGFNEADILPLAALARDRNIAVRFIELMPLGCAANLEFISGGEVAALVEKAWGGLVPCGGVDGSGPAVYYGLAGFSGSIGFINAVSHGFCETCNRLRLTSSGFLKLCLSGDAGLDLRELLRGGAGDEEIARAVTAVVAHKPRFHNFSAVYGAAGRHPGGMFAIGG